MKSKTTQAPDELRMRSADFDRVMSGALGVSPPPPGPKAQAKRIAKGKPKTARKATPKATK